MPTFRILCLAGGLLEEWQEVESQNLVDALRARKVGRGCDRVEVWTNDKRVAVLRPARSDRLAYERVKPGARANKPKQAASSKSS